MSFSNLTLKKITASLILLTLLSCGNEQQRIPQAPIAENNIFQFSEHTVYLSTNKTSDLSKDIAKKYNIEIKNNLAMLNVSIIKKSNNKSVTANINITIKDGRISCLVYRVDIFSETSYQGQIVRLIAISGMIFCKFI